MLVEYVGFKQSVIIICILFGLCSSALAEEFPWTLSDLSLQAITTVYLEMDREQTLDIKNHPDLFETNQILGRHPSQEAINTYFAGCMIGHAVISHYLPYGVYAITGNRNVAEYSRTIWQSLWIGIEYSSVKNNYSIGLRTGF